MLLKTLYAAGVIGFGLTPIDKMPADVAKPIPASVQHEGRFKGQATYLDASKLTDDQLVPLRQEVQELCGVAQINSQEAPASFRARVHSKGLDFTDGGMLLYGHCTEQVFDALKDTPWGGKKQEPKP